MATLAAETARYIEGLTITQGEGTGEPFRLLPWERRFVRGAFAPGVGEAALTVARGNGKSTLVAGIGAAALDGPIAEVSPGAEVSIVASSFDQGTIIFRHLKRFYADELAKPPRKCKFRVWDSANNARIENKEKQIVLQVRAADPRRLHGMAPKLLLLDELAQWPHTQIDRMLAALSTSMGKIPNGLVVALGTRADSYAHPFSKKIAEADYSQTHAAKVGDPDFQRRTWLKANPSLPFMPSLEKEIRREAGKARRDPSLLAAFRALRLNLGTSDTLQNHVLDADTWDRIERDAPRAGPCVWGVDLGGSAASSAVVGYWPDTGRLECVAAFPKEPDLIERGLRDGVGRLYVEAAKRGELLTLGGRAVDYVDLCRAALNRFGPPSALAGDRYRDADLTDAMKKAKVPKVALELRGMGWRDGAEDIRQFRRAALEGRCYPCPSLYLTSCFAEARTLRDPAGNEKLAKGTEGGRRLRARDDGAAAGILAVALGERRRGVQRAGAYLGTA